MVELSVIRDLVAIFGVIAGLTYYVLTVRNAQRTRELTLMAQEQAVETRQAQLFWQLTDKFTSKDGLDHMRVLGEATWSSYEEWLEKYQNDVEYSNAYSWLATIFNSRGVLLREGLLNVRLVALIASGPTLYWWEKHKDVIYNERKRRNNRRFCSEWEYSYNSLVKYLEEHPELKT